MKADNRAYVLRKQKRGGTTMDVCLKSGNYVFKMDAYEKTCGYSVWRVSEEGEVCLYKTEKPVLLTLKDYAGKRVPFESGYDAVKLDGEKILACGTIETILGSKFLFQDTIEKSDEQGTFKFSRHVDIENAQEDDLGFDSQISLGVLHSDAIRDYDYFAPGGIYKKNEWCYPHSFFDNKDLDIYWFRDLHFTLPFFAMQAIDTGDTVTFARAKKGVRASEVYDDHWDCVTHESFDFGALGVSRPGGMSMDYVFPGTEGYDEDASRYAKGVYRYQFGFRQRYHPVRNDFKQDYAIYMKFGKHADFYEMMSENWKYFFNVYDPEIADVDLEKIYKVEMELFADVCRNYHGTWGVPFKCLFPEGEIGIVDYEMGFIGQQTNIAYQLMVYGDRFGKPEYIEKGCNVIDFWVKEGARTEWGLPKSWLDSEPGKAINNTTWLRMLSDGMEGVLDAYRFQKKHGNDRTEWLDYCKEIAGWLGEHQAEDGSWPRAWYFDGSVAEPSKANTTNIIRFLVQLYLTTGDAKIKETALKAGEWGYQNAYLGFEYHGGTCDQADVLDNESGIYACFAFLSLYDMTHDKKWLKALKAAVDYTETYTWSWHYPIKCTTYDNHALKHVNMTGLSPVTTGGVFSGGDVYMAACNYIFYRAYLLLGDEHYLKYTKFLEKNTRTVVDVDGTYGYSTKRKGFVDEGSGGFAYFTLRGTYAWLPWCSYVMIDPLQRMYETFGCYSVVDAEKLPLEERLARNEIYRDYEYYQK